VDVSAKQGTISAPRRFILAVPNHRYLLLAQVLKTSSKKVKELIKLKRPRRESGAATDIAGSGCPPRRSPK